MNVGKSLSPVRTIASPKLMKTVFSHGSNTSLTGPKSPISLKNKQFSPMCSKKSSGSNFSSQLQSRYDSTEEFEMDKEFEDINNQDLNEEEKINRLNTHIKSKFRKPRPVDDDQTDDDSLDQ